MPGDLICFLLVCANGNATSAWLGFNDIERVALLRLHTRRTKDRPQGSRRATLPANDLSDVVGREAKSQDNAVTVLNCFDGDLIRRVDQRARDGGDQVNHVVQIDGSTR